MFKKYLPVSQTLRNLENWFLPSSVNEAEKQANLGSGCLTVVNLSWVTHVKSKVSETNVLLEAKLTQVLLQNKDFNDAQVIWFREL